MEVAVAMTASRRVFQGLLQQKASQNCVLYHRLDARSGCCECPQACQSRNVSRSFVSNSGLACAESGLYHAVFRETREERLERSLSDLIVLQMGGIPQRSAETGSHVVRLFAERQRETRASYALVFVDAVATFYSVVRDALWGPSRTLRGSRGTLPGVWP